MAAQSEDIRWRQRFSNFKAALTQLGKAVEIADTRPLSELEKQGVIQAFEFTHELAWNVIKDYFLYQGNSAIAGSRDASREAFNKGLLKSGDVWMEMIKSRNQTSHTYNQKIADDIVQKALSEYYPEFLELQATFEKIANQPQ